MAKERASKKNGGANRSADTSSAAATPARGGLKPETLRGIWAVVLFALALLTLLSLFEFAGVVGLFWRRALGLFFGLGTLVLPLALVGAGILALRGQQILHARARVVGIIVTLLAVLGLFHVGTDAADMVDAASAGQGGGWLGLLLSYPLRAGFGFWAALILLIAIALIGALLMLDVGLVRLFPRMQRTARNEDIHVKGIDDQPGAAPEKPSLMARLFQRRAVQPTDQAAGAADAAVAAGQAAAGPGEDADEEEPEDADEAGEPEVQVRNVPTEEPAAAAAGPALQVADLEYTPPSLDLLDSKMARPSAGDIKANVKIIRRTFENFGIPVEMGDVSIGPTVTQYTFKPAEGVKLSAVTALQNDLALALAAHPVRIEAPIPGKSLVGLEVPNEGVALVRLREILASEEFAKSTKPLPLSLGRDVAGNPVVADLAGMPHLLIAGATGSGKSIAINTLLTSLLYRNSPQQLKLILVDPKRVELTAYNGIPHLVTPVIIDPKKTIAALRWCVAEMDKRYELLNVSGKRNIASYNASAKGSKLPYIAVVIDELADLMAVAANDVEAAIVRLAQMARAVGIHLIVATQRPSVDVITGLIKANITTRMAFTVASSIDSRTILDHAGAEKLLGNGDMLYISAQLSKPRRIQGAFISESEVTNVTNFLKEHSSEPEYVEGVTNGQAAGAGAGGAGAPAGEGSDDNDPLLEQAKAVIVENQKASASLLQRRLSVGYARAARLLDIMEQKGWIGPGHGAKAREIFIGRKAPASLPPPEVPDNAPDETPTPDEPTEPPPPEDLDAPPPTESY
ncbi:MAG: DNA translocase FtsK 4TM domain-containing protein [Candidatus Andersenbacteria bacterium]